MDEGALDAILKEWLALGDALKQKIEAGQHKNEVKGAIIILDDYIDNNRFARTSPIVEALASRSRHCFLSCCFSVQSYRATMPLVRRTVRVTYCFLLRNSACYKALEEEVGNVLGRDAF